MRKKIKSLFTVVAAITMATSMLSGCGSSPAEPTDESSSPVNEAAEPVKEAPSEEAVAEETDNAGQTIEMEVGYTDEALENFRGITDDFTKATGINVELITPGSDYETVMKTRMASGDMPDVFITHGWSIARYKEYLMELNDQPWFGTVGESIKGVVSDADGKVYVLPVTQGINGLMYNKEVLDAAGVDLESLKTMDGFMDACEKIKENGAAPVYIGGKDYWTSASFLGTFAPAYYTAEGAAYPSADQLKNGSFDWEKDGLYCFNDIKDMINNEYFNPDFITADETQSFEALANGKCAFLVGGVALERILQYNPDATIGTMPVPATAADGKMQYSIGEGSAFGIWKDSEYVSEAKQLLEFLAQPETAARIVELDGMIPALSNIETAGNRTYTAFTESQALFADSICYDNLFDREYLPSGMWSVLSDSVVEVFMDPADTGVQSAAKSMQENYVEKLDAGN